MKIPYVDFKKITSKQELDNYIKEIDNGLLIYGEPKHQPSPINKDDALIVVFDDDGKQVKLKYKYYITPEGHRYRLNKNNEKMLIGVNTGLRYNIILENGDTKAYQSYKLKLWSYYPHLDWKPFCQNLKINTNQTATIDHILQNKDNKCCHYKYLEVVPRSENSTRSNFSKQADETYIKSARSRCKPFTMKLDGKQIGDVFHTSNDAVDYLSKEHNINIVSGNISDCLNGKQKTAYKGRLTGAYTEEYLNSQKDLDDEIWKTLEECFQKEAIKQKTGRKTPPKAISNRGRVMTNKGIKTYGSNRPGAKYSVYNAVGIHTLVWLAFSTVKIVDKKLLRHIDNHQSNTFDKNGNVIRYSNWFESLLIGDHKQNMNDIAENKQRVAELNPENEFVVYDTDGIEVLREYHVPTCVKKLNKRFPEKNLCVVVFMDVLKK